MKPYEIPNEFLCRKHRQQPDNPPSGSLKHQIDQIRREQCGCNMESIWLWYDLIGFQYELLLDENE